MIGVIDFGSGNLQSVLNAVRWLDREVDVVRDDQDFSRFQGIILPGVGAFDSAMKALHADNMVDPIRKWAGIDGLPFLGICLGMQLLADHGEEGGDTEGLALLPGVVRRIPVLEGLRYPHIGWNDVKKTKDAVLWGDDDAIVAYHVHGFHLEMETPEAEAEWVVGTTEYGRDLVTMIENKNIMATQFHPEKSQADGLNLMRRFLEYVEAC